MGVLAVVLPECKKLCFLLGLFWVLTVLLGVWEVFYDPERDHIICPNTITNYWFAIYAMA